MTAPGETPHPFTLLKAFPWYSKQILELDSISKVGEAGLLDVCGLGLQGLIEKLERIEKDVCNSQSTHPLRSILLASSSTMIEERLRNVATLPPESGISPGGQSDRLPIPLPPKMFFKLTSHWPNLVTRSLRLLRECGDDPAPDVGSSTNPTQSIFTSLIQRKDTIEGHKIWGNFECVAAYLSLIMKGVSDLPSTMPEFQQLVLNLCHDSRLHQDRWESFFSSIKSVHAFKLPLLLVLSSSVTCLFLPSSLMSKDLNRHALLQFSQEAEWFSALWRTIKISGGAQTFFTIVSTLEIEQMSIVEMQNHLKLGTLIIPRASKATSLDGVSLRAFAMLDKPV
ncbi:hypothetical protein H1R20_g9427, partial [Candolleomyces eurysporus]